MDEYQKQYQIKISGMTCVQCQNKIQRELLKHPGVVEATVDFKKSSASIVYNQTMTDENRVNQVIIDAGYEIDANKASKMDSVNRSIEVLVSIGLMYFIIQRFGLLNLLSPNQLVTTSMNYSMLFVVGVFTSVHCIAMCGGINLSQNIQIDTNLGELGTKDHFKKPVPLRPAFLYNFGRVASYTAVGFIVGGLGSVLDFSLTLQGVIKILVGFLMIAMGMNLLDVFPIFRKFVPRLPAFLQKLKPSGKNSPLVVGLLNGLMPCGPLQAMQLYALSTGSPIKGAFAMLMFSLGTVPLMFILSVTSAYMSKKFAQKAVAIGAMLVVVMGLSMFSQGIALSGLNSTSFAQTEPSETFAIDDTLSPQIIESTLNTRSYPEITVEAGKPVVWKIIAPEGTVNSCNNRFFIREYNLEVTLKTGNNEIRFNPEQTGVYNYTCWMGMVSGTIRVVAPGSDAVIGDTTPAPEPPKPAGYQIPTNELEIAGIKAAEDNKLYQEVKITLTDEGFSPAVIVIQKDIETRWTIDNQQTEAGNFELRVPKYATKLQIRSGENLLMLYPDQDFEFTNANSQYFGYIKVVEDLETFDAESVKNDISQFETLIYPEETYQSNSGASCH